jgi:hypothetical protein
LNNHHHLFTRKSKWKGIACQWAPLILAFAHTFYNSPMGENHFASTPVALFVFVLIMAA